MSCVLLFHVIASCPLPCPSYKRFADDTTADMEEASYVRLYSECRKAFFIMPRSWRRPSQPGSRRYFVKYLGLADSKEGTDRKLLDALAYMMYDYVGLLVENSIRNRTGGRLEALPKGGASSFRCLCRALRCQPVSCVMCHTHRTHQ